MEIPPSSSVAQISAYFTGYSNDEKIQQFLDLQPGTTPFKPTNSLDRIVAGSGSGNEADFKMSDFSYAWQMFNGQLMYPFSNIAQLEHHQFDPLYFDGSEERQTAFNVQENLIGMPLDSPQLVDPRVTYIDSLMKLREYHAGNLPLDASYLNTLFMTNTEKGANYYANQMNDLNEAMGLRSRTGFAMKNAIDIPESHYTSKLGQGVSSHDTPPAVSRFMENSSKTQHVQSNYRQDRMQSVEPIRLQQQSPNEKTVENKKRKQRQPISAQPSQTQTPTPTPTPNNEKITPDVSGPKLDTFDNTYFDEELTLRRSEPGKRKNYDGLKPIKPIGNKVDKSIEQKYEETINAIREEGVGGSWDTAKKDVKAGYNVEKEMIVDGVKHIWDGVKWITLSAAAFYAHQQLGQYDTYQPNEKDF
jgi:hypothetical protein